MYWYCRTEVRELRNDNHRAEGREGRDARPATSGPDTPAIRFILAAKIRTDFRPTVWAGELGRLAADGHCPVGQTNFIGPGTNRLRRSTDHTR
jgi:hypothetical protein